MDVGCPPAVWTDGPLSETCGQSQNMVAILKVWISVGLNCPSWFWLYCSFEEFASTIDTKSDWQPDNDPWSCFATLVGISDFTYLTEPTPGIQVQLVSKLLGALLWQPANPSCHPLCGLRPAGGCRQYHTGNLQWGGEPEWEGLVLHWQIYLLEKERLWDLGSPVMAQRRSEYVPSLVREDFGQGFSET